MKLLSKICLNKTSKLILLSTITTLILACTKEEPEFICHGDFFLEKRIVRDTSTKYIQSFPFVKKCFKIAAVQKSINNNYLKLDVELAEVGEGALGNYLTITLLYPNVSNINQNDLEDFAKTPDDFKISVHQYLHDNQETGVNFNSISSSPFYQYIPKIKSGVHNFKVLSFDNDTKTLTFTMDKLVGITGHSSYVEYKGFNPITIQIPE